MGKLTTPSTTTSTAKGEFVLVKHTIDTEIEEADGQSIADVDGDGRNNIIVGTGDGGEVYWYDKKSPKDSERHLIADGLLKLKGRLLPTRSAKCVTCQTGYGRSQRFLVGRCS